MLTYNTNIHILLTDESVVAKRKSAVGRLIEQHWVFGVYDPQTKIGAFELVPDRKQVTILPLIQKYILPGTKIWSDRAAIYVDNRYDPPHSHITPIPVNPPYLHESVNHKREFRDPITQCCTNGVELLWKNMKIKNKAMSGTSKEKLPSYLDEFQWRQLYGKKTPAAFDNILQQISVFYPVNTEC
jgi:hypothetical protein